jgi:ubiquinone/menaquinone biosynthesis C-methylase UbiE
MSENKSLNSYNDKTRAERYARSKGFGFERKVRMYEVTLDLLTTLTSPQSTVLELGCGTGLFTEKLLRAKHFQEIYATDGADVMLSKAQQTLGATGAQLRFLQLDFNTNWSSHFEGIGIDAVVSTMALHHAPDKQQLFQQIFEVLKPQGVFVLADHMAGTTAYAEYLIGRERALIRLGREAKENRARILEVIRMDEERQKEEGNRCETVARYQQYLTSSGFEDVDCLWRDYWLAVFVARKLENG